MAFIWKVFCSAFLIPAWLWVSQPDRLWIYLLATVLVFVILMIVVWRIVYLKVKARIRQVEKEKALDAERLRISRDMHDEIGSGLTLIALLSELISTQRKTVGQMKSDVGIISDTAQKLVQSMGEIIWVTHPHNDTIANLLAYLREQTQLYFEPFKVIYRIDLPDCLPDIKLSNVQRRNLFLVTKESLNNALKHARASCVTLSLRVVDKTLAFEVNDDGQGFVMGTIRRNSHGFKNMKSRMEEIEGKFNVTSEPGKGTSVYYGMPFLPASFR